MSEAGSIRVLVVDDHPMLREGIVAVIERQADMTGGGEASDGLEAIARFSELGRKLIKSGGGFGA